MYQLPKLNYSFDALEPFIDAKTMEVHYSKHHQSYLDKTNAALAGTEWENKPIKEVLQNLDKLDESIKMAVKNNGGGHYHHTFFWEILKKDTLFSGEVASAIETEFKSFDEFKKQFSEAALTQFGSGWAWLVVTEDKKLEIIKTANQDSPITIGKEPILGIDVWEHAYYLKYHNKRAEYVENFFSVINWEQVNKNYLEAIK